MPRFLMVWSNFNGVEQFQEEEADCTDLDQDPQARFGD